MQVTAIPVLRNHILGCNKLRTRVRTVQAIRELYFRRTATSGPATMLFCAGSVLTKTACANATLGARVAMPQMMMAAATQQDVNPTFRLRITDFLEISVHFRRFPKSILMGLYYRSFSGAYGYATLTAFGRLLKLPKLTG
jgi:hypothetical protein